MRPLTITQNTNYPNLQMTLNNSDGTAIDLTLATTVTFVMTKLGETTAKINSAGSVITATSGLVEYDWAAGDTDTPGTYNSQWFITWNSGGVEAVPNSGYDTIIVQDDIRT